MRRTFVASIVTLVAFLTLASTVRGDISAEQVRRSIDSGIRFLKDRQRRDGSWELHRGQDGGVTALATLALLNAGVPVGDESIQRALDYLRALKSEKQMTYSSSLLIMALANAEPERDMALIQRHVRFLERTQVRDGGMKGGWGYTAGAVRADNSNSQFALLGLHEATQVGVEIDQQVWGRAKAYWIRGQDANGGWGYVIGDQAYGSMTCAGIASLIITSENFRSEDDSVQGDQINCCGKTGDRELIEKGINWMARAFTVEDNPGPRESVGSHYLLYYLYGLERAGRLSGRRFFGEHDWYREGTEFIVDLQDETTGGWKGSSVGAEANPVIASSFALLFLSKGKRPVLIAKYKYGDGDNWDLHKKGVHFLTRKVEQEWKQKLNWQTVAGEVASVNDLLESPVLFLSGQEGIRLAQRQKESLREYVNQGGFIFAEACDGDGCNGEAFDRQFRQLMGEIFPDSPLTVLSPDHPVWFSQKRLQPDPDRPLLGIQACCRTSVIYCPKNLSCLWELSQPSRYETYSESVRSRIDSAVDIGINVLTYSTNRDMKDKLDRPRVLATDVAAAQARDALIVPKLTHGGGADDAPGAWPNILKVVGQQLDLRVIPDRSLVSPSDGEVLFDFPILFAHGRRSFEWTDDQRENLREYLENGGFLFVDSICASTPFADSIRREIEAIFPGQKLERLPDEHPMFTQDFRGFDLRRVSLQTPVRAADGGPTTVRTTSTAPILEGLEIDGRLVVVLSPYDISCAMENAASTECKGYRKEDAARIGVNIILFAMLQ